MNYEVIVEPHEDRFGEPGTFMLVQLIPRKFLVFEWCSIKVIKSGLTEENIRDMVDALVEWQNR